MPSRFNGFIQLTERAHYIVTDYLIWIWIVWLSGCFRNRATRWVTGVCLWQTRVHPDELRPADSGHGGARRGFLYDRPIVIRLFMALSAVGHHRRQRLEVGKGLSVPTRFQADFPWFTCDFLQKIDHLSSFKVAEDIGNINSIFGRDLVIIWVSCTRFWYRLGTNE